MIINKVNWQAASHVNAYYTTRIAGVSSSPYHHFNLADHVGESLAVVLQNRYYLQSLLTLPNPPLWLTQTHGDIVINADSIKTTETQQLTADAIYTTTSNRVCVILTADCLPILVSNQQGTEIAAIHAGWRGLAQSIIAKTIKKFASPTTQLKVWLGPAISGKHFEIDRIIYQQFLTLDQHYQSAFTANRQGHWLADLYAIAGLQLKQLGIRQLYGGNYCTFSQPKQFYSYRKQATTGRIASLIWMSHYAN